MATAIAAAALLLPATAPAAAGSLDRSFNGNGRLVIEAADYKRVGIPLEVTDLALPQTLSAPGPKGELVVVDVRRVLRFRSDGRPQKRFGGDGRVKIPAPSPGMSFQLAGLAVDSRGRVLVAGTTKPTEATGGSLHARVSVYRFTSRGRLDRGFGAAGVAGASLGPMEASGLAVDSRDRPVLTGFAALTPTYCNKTLVYLNTTIVARLTAGGFPDPAFGGGAFTDPLEDPFLPALTRGGRVVYVSSPERRCAGFDGYPEAGASPVASILSPSGGLLHRTSLRPDRPNMPGLARILEVTSLDVDRRNRIVILMTGIPAEAGGRLQVVRRLLPDGSFDPEFSQSFWEGEPGIVGTPGPAGGRFHALATDARNRVVLAGSVQRHEDRLVPEGFLAMRLNAAGRVQTWFGRDGAVRVTFGRLTDVTPTQVHLDSRGRIVLSGRVVTLRRHRPPTDAGLAFARLLSGGR
ncbi:MAG TPA: hypothetical protein VFY69_01365 [Solirubrobacterales bacterium]|nr:hypothetical protein [Solirubrobacterales bacterium]